MRWFVLSPHVSLSYMIGQPSAGVDLHALAHSRPAEKDSASGSAEPSEERRGPAAWVPDWTRAALDEVFGPLAETASLLQMSKGAEANANMGSR